MAGIGTICALRALPTQELAYYNHHHGYGKQSPSAWPRTWAPSEVVAVRVAGLSTLVTGGASGLGRASAEALIGAGASVVIVDLPTSTGAEVADALGATFVPADVTSTDQMNLALDVAEQAGPLRAVVHCAGRGIRVRVIEKDGSPGSLETYQEVINLNLVGTFNVLRLCAARMATADPIDDERGVCVLTASVAAWEGQIGQIPYASSKAGIVGMTLVAARDLASKLIRVVTIAPGVMDTPILDRIRPDVKEALEASVPNPRRLGRPSEFAELALAIISNQYLNGETIRLDGGIRMTPR
jgi:NAD(P)-dependent dehydrogenase (short-subunit alcohol dehydrogenase family)